MHFCHKNKLKLNRPNMEQTQIHNNKRSSKTQVSHSTTTMPIETEEHQPQLQILQISTCVLKVNVDCHGCRQKVKRILKKIEGVYTVSIDGDQQTAIVKGVVDPSTLIKKLIRSGKHAELCSTSSDPLNQNQEQPYSGKSNKSNKKKPSPQMNTSLPNVRKDTYGEWAYDGNESQNRTLSTEDINSMIAKMGIQQQHHHHQHGYNTGASVGSGWNKFQDYSVGLSPYGYQHQLPLTTPNMVGPYNSQNPYAGWFQTNPISTSSIINNRISDGYARLYNHY